MIAIHNLQKVIEQRTILDIEKLTVKTGEVVALVGPAGSGKSTLLKLLTGQTQPTVGTIQIAGLDPFKEKQLFSRKVGVLFEEDGLYKNRSPRKNLLFFCHLYGIPQPGKRVEEILARVGLADQADAKLAKLPSGLVRRLAFGRAILHTSEVLLLENPFARCDAGSILLLDNLIRQLAEEETTILILDEDTTHLESFCDTIYQLERGRISQSYHPQEKQQPGMPFKIPVRLEGRVLLLNPAEILYAEAEEGHAFLQTAEERYPTQFTLGELEKKLALSGFFRAHRGYLVNLQHVSEIIPYTRNSFSLLLDNAQKTEIPLSKGAAGELRALLGY